MYGIATINRMNLPVGHIGTVFKKGDRVSHRGMKGVVVETDHPVKDDNNHPGALVEFDDKGIIPPIYAIPYRFLSHELKTITNTGIHCPICRTPWKETVGERNIWQDCLKCGRTKEDIMEEWNAKIV